MRVSYEPTPFPLAKDVWAEPVRPNGAITDYQLDEYHRELLTASNAIKNLLGSTSVVYWGFYTWSPEIAHIRARRHLMGFRSRLGTSPERIADAFARMDTAASMGEALEPLPGFHSWVARRLPARCAPSAIPSAVASSIPSSSRVCRAVAGLLVPPFCGLAASLTHGARTPTWRGVQCFQALRHS